MPAITTHDDVAAGRRGEVALWAGLALCMAVGPLMLYTLTAVSPLIIDGLDLSPAQYGAIAAITFVAAALGALLLAGPSSRYGARTVMVAVSIGAGAGLALLAVADSYPVVLAAAVVSGLAQALSNPATNRIVGGLPADRRGALIGWKQSGVQMAQLAAGLAAPAIALLVGWRWAPVAGVVVAIAGVVTAVAIRPYAPTASRPVGEVEQSQASVGTLTAYTFFMGFGLQATNAYLPLFAHRRLGFDVGTAGLTAAVVGCVGLASRIWWARTSDRVGLRPTTLLSLATGSALGVVLAVLAMWFGGWLLWIGAGVFGAAALASNAVTMVALVRSVPVASLGKATGLLTTGMYAGFATGPLGFGLVLDHSGVFGIAWLLPLGAFGAAALIGLPSALTRPVRNS